MFPVLQVSRRRRPTSVSAPSAALPHVAAFAMLAAATVAAPPPLAANPAGEAVRHGSASFERSPGELLIRQTSQRAVIDWQSFSIDSGETTRFLQPNAAAAALNRVRGDSASVIEGALRANGQVYLINPNGILVGPRGTIDVGGFVASTLDVSDRDFLAGGDLRFAGNSAAAVVNLGSISAFDGDVVLIASSVTNAGTIRAPRGTAALAAGSDVLLAESGEERVFVRGPSGGGATNTGTVEANIAELKAHGGNVYGMAVKNEGRVAATGVTRQGGQIFLSAKGGRVRSTGTLQARRSDGSGGRIAVDSGAEGRTEIGGTVDASAAPGSSGAGGEIAILGNRIEVFDGALILNDGESAGGTTRIGGGLRGQEDAFANAEDMSIGHGARISAAARGSGEGGRVIVFAEGTLQFRGSVSVAGASGGRGGFVELSGQRAVFIENLSGQVDLGAATGPAGTLLLDPIDISVVSGANDGVVAGTEIRDGSIVHFLENTGNLVITTSGAGGSGDITLVNGVEIQWSTPHNLTFEADRDFVMTPGTRIEATGDGAFNATAARSILVGNGASITTTHGNLTLLANQQANPSPGDFTGIFVDGGTVRSLGSGDVALQGRGGTGTNNNYGVRIDSGAQVLGGTSGTLYIEGVGGSAAGSIHTGVTVSGTATLVGSSGAHVVIEGYGGSHLDNSFTSGVFVTGGSTVSAGGAGSLSLYGVGGAGSGFNNVGVFVTSPIVGVSTTVTTADGDISIVGVGGGGASSFGDEGVRLISGNGVTVVDSNGGRITVEGTGGPNASGNVGIDTSASISSDGGDIELLTDRLRIGTHFGSQINSGSGTTTILALSEDFAIHLGSDNVAGSALWITNDELGRISAALVQIGNSASGTVTVSAAITHGNALSITSGGDIVFNESVTMAPDASLDLATEEGTILFLGSDTQVHASGTGSIWASSKDLVVDGASLAVVGSGGLSLYADRALLVQNALLSVQQGDLFLYGNSGEAYQPGAFSGVTVIDSQIESHGLGTIELRGWGGSGGSPDFTYPGFSNPGAIGVRLAGGTRIVSHDADSDALGISIVGYAGWTGSGSHGLVVDAGGATIETAGRSILLGGSGGGDYYDPGGSRGVHLIGAEVLAGGEGRLDVEGYGSYDYGYGYGSGGNEGVYLGDGTSLKTEGGDLRIEGTASDENSDGILGTGTTLSSGGGLLSLHGSGGWGGGAAIRFTSTGGRIGESGDEVKLVSGTGDVLVDAQVKADSLRLVHLDSTPSHAFVLENLLNEVNLLATGEGTVAPGNDGVLGSLSFRAASGFSLGATGVSAAGDIRLVSGGALTIDAPLVSSLGKIEIEGLDLLIDAPVSAGGDLEIRFGSAAPATSGTADIRTELVSGGSTTFSGNDGDHDTLRFDQYAGPALVLAFDDLDRIEHLIGPGRADDRLLGPAAASTYLINGSDAFELGATSVSGFPNLTGGAGDDLFRFAPGGFLSGQLDGGSGGGTLDYSLYDTAVVVDLAGGAATGIGGGFENIETFTGSSNFDTVTGPGSASVYQITGPDQLQVGSFSLSGFENLVGGPGADRFVFLAGASLRGFLDGGATSDPAGNTLDYSGYGSPVTVNLGAPPSPDADGAATGIGGGFSNLTTFLGSASASDRFFGPAAATVYEITGANAFAGAGFAASGFETLVGGPGNDTFRLLPGGRLDGTLQGGAGTDTLSYALFGSAVTVNVGLGTATALGGFSGIERLVGSSGNDTFNFYNQATVDFIDGGPGNDTVRIDDSTLQGNHTYTVSANGVDRNPSYRFANVQNLRLLLGPGNNTVNSGFYTFNQFLVGGQGFNTLNLPGVPSLAVGSPIQNVHFSGFSAPMPAAQDDLLQNQVNQNLLPNQLGRGDDFDSINRFNSGLAGELRNQFAGLGGAFSAAAVGAIAGQALVVVADDGSYLVLRAFSLDGSGLSPSNLALGQLDENLGLAALLELGAAIGFEGAVLLFVPDGPWSLDLSTPPEDPDLLAALSETINFEAARELSEALGIPLVLLVAAENGALAVALDGAPLPAPLLQRLAELLADEALAELAAAIGE